MLLALPLLAGCNKSPRQEAKVSSPRDTRPALLPARQGGFVGLLSENAPGDDTRPAIYCLEDGLVWRGAAARLGRINVVGVAMDPAWFGHHVIVWGTREPSLDAVVERVGLCPPEDRPMPQMRSDWIADEGGYVTTHARLAKTPVLRADRIEPVALAVTAPGPHGGVTVALTNPFDAPLAGVTRIQHEGGPGKPMAHFEEHPLTLAPGATLTLNLNPAPTPAPGVKGSRWRLEALHVVGSAGRLTVDVTILLR